MNPSDRHSERSEESLPHEIETPRFARGDTKHVRLFIFWAIVVLLWANLPYIIGYASSAPQSRFGGFFLYEQDGNSYLAKMRQGARGAWNFHLPYTSEDQYQSGGFVYPFYLILGKLEILGLNDQFLYHAARILSSLLLLIVLFRFIARFIQDRHWQLWTWWLLLFSGGWGLLISYLVDPKYVAYELIAPDGFIFSILYGPPHVILGFALLLLWISYTLDTFQADRSRWPQRVLLANLIGGAATLSREAYGAVFVGVLGAFVLARSIQHRKILWHELIIVALSSLTAIAYLGYLFIALQTIPGLNIWYQQNPFGSPNLVDFIFGFAPLLILALIGLRLQRRDSILPDLFVSPSRILTFAWLLVGPIMAYLPISISRRLIAGWQVPLCIFGGYALMKLWQSRRALASLVMAAMLPTTLLIIVGGSALVAAKPPTLFQSSDDLAALDWLSRNTTDRDVVLSDWRFGNLVPIYANGRVFIGHPIETAFFKDKEAEVEHFFDPNTGDLDRRAFLSKWQVTLIAVGPAESIGLGWDVQNIAFQQGTYSIYRFSP